METVSNIIYNALLGISIIKQFKIAIIFILLLNNPL